MADAGMLPRRKYKDGLDLSIVAFGGLVASNMAEADLDRLAGRALDMGVNYVDTAPTYGDCQTRLAPVLRRARNGLFLACKTIERSAAGLRRQFDESLATLAVEHFDLYQFHAVDKPADMEQLLAPGGGIEAAVALRQQGKARFLGFSTHNQEVGIRMLQAFPFDSVMFPVNFVAWAHGFGPPLMDEAKRHGTRCIALKALAHRPRARDEKPRYDKCWYQPIDDRSLALQAMRFTLSQDVVAMIPPGNERIFEMALDLASGLGPAAVPMSPPEQRKLLDSAATLTPMFQCQ